MQRNLEKMAGQTYDLLVVGGGITGSCIAWDAALRGLKVGLVEQKDFSWATSSATSKLIHGGLRYLKNLEFSLVRESLRERRIMEMIAPHLVSPLPFLIPTYGSGMRGKFMLWAAMTLYDILSFDRKWLHDEDKRIPGFKNLKVEQTLAIFPAVQAKGLTGGIVYYDCQMHSPDRLTLEFILSAAEFGAEIANYAKVTSMLIENKQVVGCEVVDQLSQKTHQLKAKMVVNAAGPWADRLIGMLEGKSSMALVRSKGIHVITKPLVNDHALVLQTPKGRHFFIIPWRGHSLIGTTDKFYEGTLEEFQVTENDLLELIKDINSSYPAANLQRSDILHFYGGLRPIVDDQTEVKTDSYEASRKYEVLDHAKESGIAGMLTVVGGKYTTSRHLAQQVVDQVLQKLAQQLGTPVQPCATHATPLSGGEFGRFRSFNERLKRRYPQYPAAVVDNLCRYYGARALRVIQLMESEPHLREPLHDRLPDVAAQIQLAMMEEMAMTLGDAMFRRTGLGTLGYPGDNTVNKVMALMTEHYQWSEAIQQEQLLLLKQSFQRGVN